ncbi:hypothetical protein [Paractinoplanes globisporus]|uniref:Uncharacterized protein n=1 Tax=Paractinoplanes globisporus TaxID=113565 RepID=A0ABW6W3L5_9ACTN|nr:hypothetical protein [Actinoplanes globisporus]
MAWRIPMAAGVLMPGSAVLERPALLPAACTFLTEREWFTA